LAMSVRTNRFAAAQIARACGGRIVSGPPRATASAISTDSRTLRRGEAFFALVGPRYDAHRFVPGALQAGAAVVVAQRLQADWPRSKGVAFVVVDDTTDALVRLAAWHRNRLRGVVVAVTGSCGKSTVKGMVAAILGRCGRCSAAPRSFNNRIGVSLTLLDAREEDDYVVVEMGANAPGEIDELARCARPHVGVITCIGECHLEGFGDIEGVRRAKAELVAHLPPGGGLAVNADDRLCLATAEGFQGEVRTFGFSPGAAVRPEGLRRRDEAWEFSAAGCRFRLAVAGRHNVLNAAAAISASLLAGAQAQCASEALWEFQLPPLRYARHHIQGVTFIEDCYNSNPTALRAAIEAFMDEPVAGRRVMVCGDMLELGQRSEELHVSAGRFLAAHDIQMLVAVGRFGRQLLAGWNEVASFSRRAMRFKDAEGAWRALWKELRAGDAVLIKGSRAMELERIVDSVRRFVADGQEEVAA